MRKILVGAVEAKPYATAGGTSDVVGSLSRELRQRGYDLRLVLPYYRNLIREPRYTLETVTELEVPAGGSIVAAPVYTDGQGTYFIGGDPDGYFGRVGQDVPLYPALENSNTDAGTLYAFFCRAVLELAREFKGEGWRPDIIHGHDWPLGLLPAMMQSTQRDHVDLRDVKAVFTIHNMSDVVYQGGWFGPEILAYAGLPERLFTNKQVEHNGHVNFIKAGIVFAHRVNTVSEGYAREILDGRVESYETWDGRQRRFQCSGGLDAVWSDHGVELIGIRNGIDDSYTPARIGQGEDWQLVDRDWTPHYARSEGQSLTGWAYSAGDPELQRKKGELKRYLQERCNRLLGTAFEEDEHIAVLAVRSRLTEQKGFDLILRGLADWQPAYPAQIVIVAWGEERYAKALRDLAAADPKRIAFSESWRAVPELLHYASADMLLMPSLFEPCGLPHMMALRYGTVPIVRRTGGLADVVQDFDAVNLMGNGFDFERASPGEMLQAIERALELYYTQSGLWTSLCSNAMQARDRAGKDFSWATAADRYITDLYAVSE